jgi:hypothetical protein
MEGIESFLVLKLQIHQATQSITFLAVAPGAWFPVASLKLSKNKEIYFCAAETCFFIIGIGLDCAQLYSTVLLLYQILLMSRQGS